MATTGPASARVLSVTTVLIAVVVSAIVMLVSFSRPLSGLEQTLFQIIVLGLGLSGSFAFGKVVAAASPVPSVRSAFRRVVALYDGLGRLSQSISQRHEVIARASHEGQIGLVHVEAALDLLNAQVTEQIQTADDAMEDWRDLAPAEVAALEQQRRRIRGQR